MLTILENSKNIIESSSLVKRNYLFVKDGNKLTKILFDNILYVKGLRNYIKIVTKDKIVISYMRMKNIEKILPSKTFFRVHRSYIVNLFAVNTIKGNSIKITNVTDSIIISKRNKTEFIRLLGIDVFET